ncbi:hypothetical protein PIB30_074177 [Stylosanthes scabra]|uniref:Uncharacterized protein n=1 Tax=Stylosanthes scabra TaxID=79078 RepID=A0ABU6QPL6_9FABA|nr:hypothetical protein [Stylosanthes scabra]
MVPPNIWHPGKYEDVDVELSGFGETPDNPQHTTVAWKEEVIVQIRGHDSFYTHFVVADHQQQPWEVIGVYIHTEEATRGLQVARLLEVLEKGGDGVVVIEDFNTICSHHEKVGVILSPQLLYRVSLISSMMADWLALGTKAINSRGIIGNLEVILLKED